MPDTSPVLALPLIQPAQAQKHVTHNEALLLLDAVVQLAVEDRDRTAPPALLGPGQRHIVAAGATGDWAGQDGMLALHDGTGWRFFAPRAGWRAEVLGESGAVIFDGTTWLEEQLDLDNLAGLGIGTASDATNRLAVAAPATLLSHAGGGHQLKVNKAAPGDTASLLFQTNWSGRAEMGLTGSDGWSVKVSADGSTWTEALSFDAATGLATGAAVQAQAYDAVPGRLLTSGAGGLLGHAQSPAGNYADLGTSGFLGDATGSGPSDKPRPDRAHAGLHVATSAQRWMQMLAQTSGSGTEDCHVWLRTSEAGVTEPWHRLYSSRTALAPVARAAGVPTPDSGLLESGTTASGTFLRFADGSQVCQHTLLLGARDAQGAGSYGDPYRSPAQSWTYPAAFSAAPQVIATGACAASDAAAAHAIRLAGIGTDSVAVVQAAMLSSVSGSDPVTAQLVAIGRWSA